MKKTIIAALAAAAALSLGACSRSDDATNTAITDLSVNEGGGDGNVGAIDDVGNAAAADDVLLDNGTLGNDAPSNLALGNGTAGNGL